MAQQRHGNLNFLRDVQRGDLTKAGTGGVPVFLMKVADKRYQNISTGKEVSQFKAEQIKNKITMKYVKPKKQDKDQY